MSIQSTQSLSQWAASIGGIAIADRVLQGEIEQIRSVNSGLRGNNSILRRDGMPLDQAVLAAIDEGFLLDVDDVSAFLDALGQDAYARIERTERGRVWPAQWEGNEEDEWQAYLNQMELYGNGVVDAPLSKTDAAEPTNNPHSDATAEPTTDASLSAKPAPPLPSSLACFDPDLLALECFGLTPDRDFLAE